MVNRRRKKSLKTRGSQTCGWGGGKRHRNKGSRGGAGLAGKGKRGAQKRTMYFSKGIFPIGFHGMRLSRHLPVIKAINLGQIEINLEQWLNDKLIKKEGDTYLIDLKSLGYNKVLGTGELSHKVKITADYFSKSAKEKLGVKE